MSVSDSNEEFDLEPESDEDFGLDESLVSSEIAAAISNILADIPVAQAQEFPDIDGNIDIRSTSMGNDIVFADVGGVTFISGDLAEPFGSGTGGYSPFLSLRDSNQNPLNSDGEVHAFNVDSTSDPLLNDLIFGNSRTNAVALSNLVITVIDGEEFFEIRLDLNEPDSGTDSQLQFSDITMYFGDGSIASFADLAGATEVWDLDSAAGEDVTLQLNDNFSGSGTDDYQIFIPVELFRDPNGDGDTSDGANFAEDYFILEVTAGSSDPASEFAMEGGFFEFNVQAAGSASGIKFLDENNNGILDNGEGPPVDSFVIYVDENEDGFLNFTDDGDGVLEFNGDDIILERFTTTAPDGSYILTGLAEGTYQIREYLPPDSGYVQTTGAFETVTIVEDTDNVVDPIGNRELVPVLNIIKEVTSVDGSMNPLDFIVDEAGDLINYLITVNANGSELDLTNVVVTDPLLSNLPLEGVDNDFDGFNDGDLDEDNVLDVSESWTYEGSYIATQEDINTNGGGNGFIDNTATATSTEVGPENAEAAVAVDRNPDIDIIKEVTAVDGDTMNLFVDEDGDQIDYQISVTTGDGNVELTNVVVTDPLLSNTPLVLVSGDDGDGVLELDETWIYEGSYTATQDDINDNGGGNGLIDNTASATSDQVGPDTASATVPVVRTPEIDIVKEVTAVDGDTMNLFVDEDGDQIDYQISVTTGDGNVDLTNVVVTDSLLSDDPLVLVSGDDGDGVLELGETWIYEGSYTATQDDINDNGGGNGLIDNTAFATSDQVGPDQASATVPVVRTPEIDIVKEVTAVDGDTMNLFVDEDGDQIDYQISVTTGDGNVELTNVVVTDPLLSNTPLVLVSGDDGDGVLELDETWIFEGSYTATQDDINDNGGGNGLIDNTAFATSDQVGPDQASATVPVVRTPGIDIVKEVTAVGGSNNPLEFIVDEVGDQIDYQISVSTGDGNVELTNVEVTDALLSDDPLVLVSGDDGDGVLELDETWVYEGSYTATEQDLLDNGGGDGTIDNTAFATSTEVGPVDDSASVEIDQADPQISIIKEVIGVGGSNDPMDFVVDAAGDVIDYRITVTTGDGNVGLSNVVVTDPLLSDVPLDGVDDDLDGFNDGDTNEDNILDVGESWIYDGSYAATQDDLDSNGGGDGDIDNTATATSTEAGPEQAVEAVQIAQNPSILIDKDGAFVDDNMSGFADVGETIDYTLLVTNNGNLTLDTVVVTDPDADAGSILEVLTLGGFNVGDADEDGVLDVGEAWSYTAVHTLTQGDIDAGSFENLATVNAMDPNDMGVMAEDPHLEPLPQDPSILIDKDGAFVDDNMSGFADVGETIDYTLLVTNDGNVTLDNVVITDPDADAGSIAEVLTLGGFNVGDLDEDGALDVGEAWSYTAVHTLTQDDIDAGLFENLATVNADDPNDGDVTANDPHLEELPQDPSILIDKDGAFVDNNLSGFADVGETIDYTLLVTNDGNVTLDTVVVTDPDADAGSILEVLTLGGFNIGDANEDGQLDVGEMWSYTAVHTLTQDDIDAGSFENLATVNADDPNDGNVTANDPHVEPLPQDPSILIDKDGAFIDDNMSGFADVGETIDYTLLVTNDGNVTLDSVVVTDPDADAGSIAEVLTLGGFNVGDLDEDSELDVGEAWSYTAVHTLTQGDIDAGSFENLATVNADDPNGNDVTADDPHVEPLPQDPSILIDKDGTFVDDNMNGLANVGETIDYTLLVTNDGNVTLDNVVVTDPNADAGSIAEVLTLGGFNVGDIDEDGDLDVGEMWSYTAVHTLTQGNIDAGSFMNTATVNAMDPNDANVMDEDPHVEVLPGEAAVLIDKDGSFVDDNMSGFADMGETIDYTLLVTNNGNLTLDNVIVTDPDADAGSIAEVLTLGGFNVGDINEDGELDVGEAWSYTAVHTLTQDDIDAGSFANLATVNADDPNDEGVTDDDPHVEELPQDPSILIDKDGAFVDDNMSGFADVGETIDYTLLVTNDGTVTLDSVVVTDPDADAGSIAEVLTLGGFNVGDLNEDGELDVGEAWSYTAVHTLTQDDIDTGSFENLATVNADDPNDGNVTDNDPHIEQLPQDPSILIDKDGAFIDDNLSGFADVGETIDYTLLVTNDGNVTLDSVVVTDPDADAGSIAEVLTLGGFNIGDADEDGELDVGEAWSYTAVHTLTQDDIDAGSFENLATVDADDPNDGNVTADDPHVEELPQDPSILIDKEGALNTGGDGIANVGDTIDYTLAVSNDGNVTLDNVVVTDPDADAGSIAEVLTLGGFNVGDLDEDGELDVGESWDYTAAHTLTQDDIDAGEFTNIADADATAPDGTPVNAEDPHTEDIPAVPLIEIDKDGVFADENMDGFANVGETIQYTLEVNNVGNVSLDTIEVTDPDADAGSIEEVLTLGGFNIGDLDEDGELDVDESWSYTAVHTITQAEIDAGSFTNIATVCADDPTSDDVMDLICDDDDHREELPQDPSILIDKDGAFVDGNMDGLANVGETIDYTLLVTNDGNVTLDSIVVTDPDADAGSIAEVLTLGGFNIGDADEDGELDVGEAWSYTAVHTLTQDDIDAGSFENLATVNAMDPNDDDVTANDPHLEDLPTDPSILIDKEGAFIDDNMDGFADVGETIDYTLLVTNDGNVTLDSVVVSDPDADAGSIAEVLTLGGFNVGDVNEDGELDVGEAWSYTAVHTLTQDDIDAGEFENLATVNAMDPQDNDVTANDPHLEPLPQNPLIDIDKNGVFADEDGDTYADVGETIQYTLAVSNIGNVTLDEIDVSDPGADAGSIAEVLAGGFNVGDVDSDGELDVGETWSYTAIHTITEADIEAGSYTNIATVCADDPTSDDVLDLVCDEDDHTEELPAPPDGWFGTPGFWKNHTEFFDGILGNEPKQAGQEYFPEGEMTTVVDGVPGIWLDLDDDGLVGENEFWSTEWLLDALEGGGGKKGPRNAVDTLERDLAALVLNIAASPNAGSDNNPDNVDPNELIQFAQEWLNAYDDDFVRTNSDAWKEPQFDGPSASDLHSFIDQLNNTGSFDGNEEFPGGTFGEDRDGEDEEVVEEAVEASFANDYVAGELYTIKYSAPEDDAVADTKEGSTISKDISGVTIEDYFALMANDEFMAEALITEGIKAPQPAPEYNPSELFTIKYSEPVQDGVAESKFDASVNFLATLDDAYAVQALTDEEHLFYDANDLIDAA